jgi:ankyrin repeat protein
MAAALNGHVDVVRALLAKGANIEAADQSGGNSVTYAVANGHSDIFETLVKAGAKWKDEDLVVAAQGCHTDTVQKLMTMGAKANALRGGRSALFMAVWNHCGDAATLLVERGADVNAKGSDGRTALMQAAGDGRTDLVQLLMDHGADMEAKDDAGRTAWMYAAMGNQLEVAEIFKKAREKKQ